MFDFYIRNLNLVNIFWIKIKITIFFEIRILNTTKPYHLESGHVDFLEI